MKKEPAQIENEGKANNGVFSFGAHVGGNNRRLSAAPLISGMVKLNPRVEFIRFYWERGRRKSKFTEGGLGAPEKSGGGRGDVGEEEGRKGKKKRERDRNGGGRGMRDAHVVRVYQV